MQLHVEGRHLAAEVGPGLVQTLAHRRERVLQLALGRLGHRNVPDQRRSRHLPFAADRVQLVGFALGHPRHRRDRQLGSRVEVLTQVVVDLDL